MISLKLSWPKKMVNNSILSNYSSYLKHCVSKMNNLSQEFLDFSLPRFSDRVYRCATPLPWAPPTMPIYPGYPPTSRKLTSDTSLARWTICLRNFSTWPPSPEPPLTMPRLFPDIPEAQKLTSDTSLARWTICLRNFSTSPFLASATVCTWVRPIKTLRIKKESV